MRISGFCTAILVHINSLHAGGTNSDAKVARSASEEQKDKVQRQKTAIK